MEEQEIALEEWKQAGSIVSHQEVLIFRIRSWYLTLVTAVTVLLLRSGQDIAVEPEPYFLLCAVLTILFLWLEVLHRIPLRKAVSRARAIEPAIRGESGYDGFRLSSAMGDHSDSSPTISIVIRARVWMLYAVVTALCAVVAFLVHS